MLEVTSRFASLLMSFQFMQYIFDNKKTPGSSPTQGRERISPGAAQKYRVKGWHMQANFSDQLRRAISHERLDAYRKHGSSKDDAELFAHYAWNMALSESLYTPPQCLEVSLRNCVHDSATAHFKTETWFDLFEWFTHTPTPSNTLTTQHLQHRVLSES